LIWPIPVLTAWTASGSTAGNWRRLRRLNSRWWTRKRSGAVRRCCASPPASLQAGTDTLCPARQSQHSGAAFAVSLRATSVCVARGMSVRTIAARSACDAATAANAVCHWRKAAGKARLPRRPWAHFGRHPSRAAVLPPAAKRAQAPLNFSRASGSSRACIMGLSVKLGGRKPTFLLAVGSGPPCGNE